MRCFRGGKAYRLIKRGLHTHPAVYIKLKAFYIVERKYQANYRTFLCIFGPTNGQYTPETNIEHQTTSHGTRARKKAVSPDVIGTHSRRQRE